MFEPLIYTFKNFPYKSCLGLSVFEFHKLTSDFQLFQDEIIKLKPTIVIGVAKSPTNKSNFESRAVNQYNHAKKLDVGGIYEYTLDYPENGFGSIGISADFTDSFCNWTMYRISQILVGTDTRLQFIHIAEPDLPDMEKYLMYIRDNKVQYLSVSDS